MNPKSSERIGGEEYKEFFRLSTDLLCIAGVDGYFKALNPAWETVLGYSREELLSVPYLDFVHPEDREATVGAASQLGGGEVIISFDNRYRCKDGSYRWLHWSAVPDPGTGRVYAVARDMTRRKEAEAALAAAKDAAEAATRAKSDFLASMSHELRTPLNSVIGFSSLLLSSDDWSSDKETVYLQRIKANGELLLLMINDLLDLEKVEAGKMDLAYEEVDLGRLVGEVAATFEAELVDRTVALELEVPTDLPPLLTDHQKLTQVLANLVGNAIKFTDAGQVTLRVLPKEGSGRAAAIEVQDTGIGIPADRLERIFGRFEQVEAGTARRYPGTGLGLAISRALCELMGYELTVTSELGVGSTFRVEIGGVAPMLGDAAALDRDSQRIALSLIREIQTEVDRSPFHQQVVLVIDDQADSRDLLSQLLRDVGCQVLTAASARQGLRLAREHAPDLVTLDLVMPSTDGWQLLEMLTEDPQVGSVPVVVISTVADDGRAQAAGVAEFLEKPVEAGDLERVLCRQLTPRVGRVLLVESRNVDRERLERSLAPGAEEIRFAASAEGALEVLAGFTPDQMVISLDLSGSDGRALVEMIRRQPHLRDLPIILTCDHQMKLRELESVGRELAPVVRLGPHLEENLRELCWEIQRRRGGGKDGGEGKHGRRSES